MGVVVAEEREVERRVDTADRCLVETWSLDGRGSSVLSGSCVDRRCST